MIPSSLYIQRRQIQSKYILSTTEQMFPQCVAEVGIVFLSRRLCHSQHHGVNSGHAKDGAVVEGRHVEETL